MNLRLIRLSVIGLASILIGTACQPKATTPQVDTMATTVAQIASSLLTQTAAAAATAAAATPTPSPPTITITPSPTETAVIPLNQSGQPKLPQTITVGASCWLGAPNGPILETHLNKGKGVQLLGVGSVPGWYIIRDPYFHRPCWISENDLKIFPGTDPSTFPVMTPGGTPQVGQ